MGTSMAPLDEFNEHQRVAKNTGLTKFFGTHKKGSFHSQLGVPKDEKIPLELLVKIKDAHVGEVVFNEHHVTKAKTYIKVTELLQKKAQFLWNLRRDR